LALSAPGEVYSRKRVVRIKFDIYVFNQYHSSCRGHQIIKQPIKQM